MYASYYGFKQEPFNLTPDPQFFFLGEKHQKAHAHLLYGIQNQKGFIALTGEVGAGKTTLCRLLLKQMDESYSVALILNSRVDELTLLKQINRDFGIPFETDSQDELIGYLYDFLIVEKKKNRNVLVIVDECQNLKFDVLEEIRMLSNLETEKDKLLQILLIGQPEFLDMLNSHELRQLNQRITVKAHITALDRKEIEAYIYHRLKIAGNENAVKFTRSAMKKIISFSKGIPRKINVICDYALLAGYAHNTSKISGEIIERALKDIEVKRECDVDLTSQGGNTGLRSFVRAAVLLIILFLAGYVAVLKWEDPLSQFKELVLNRTSDALSFLSDASGPAYREFSKNTVMPISDEERSAGREQPSSSLFPSDAFAASQSPDDYVKAVKIPPNAVAQDRKNQTDDTRSSSVLTEPAFQEEKTEPDEGQREQQERAKKNVDGEKTIAADSPHAQEPASAEEKEPASENGASHVQDVKKLEVQTSQPALQENIQPVADAVSNLKNDQDQDPVINSYYQTLTSKEKAIWLLLSNWGIELSHERKDEHGEKIPLGDQMKRFHFVLFPTWADMPLLEKINLPCAMEIQENNQTGFWVLKGIQDQQMYFSVAPGKTKVVTRKEFLNLWQGNALILVEIGENTLEGEMALHRGMRGEDVVKLKKILSDLGYFKGESDDPLFSMELERSVKDFQERYQLVADGIIGVETKLLFYSQLAKNIPRIVSLSKRNEG
ncbi:MAG: AAA family ATPase [Candidatus Aureabacteria bacterium]|nr:AAA family ATPase [Candidatus Auribacterota bacterium]